MEFRTFDFHEILIFVFTIFFSIPGKNFAKEVRTIFSQRSNLYENKIDRHVVECPRQNGIFPYSEDCSKYLNCAHGIPYIQSCGPGTLFNPISSICDHAYNVRCRPKQPEVFLMTTQKPKQSWSPKVQAEVDLTDEIFMKTTTRPKKFSWAPRTRESTTSLEPPLENEKKSRFWNFLAKTKKVVTNIRKGFKSLKNKTKNALKGTKNIIRNIGSKTVSVANATYGKVGKNIDSKFHKAKNYFGKKPPSLCLKPTGQFPYPKDCSKFVNCWKGRGTLMDCSPGTLFDASSQTCAWPANAVCSLTIKKNPTSSVKKINPPFSGQLLRLRHGGAPYVGYLQVWTDGEWRSVVSIHETFESKDKICQILGYERGAQSEIRGLVYGWTEKENPRERVLVCPLDPKNLTNDCSKKFMASEEMSKTIIGIRCKKNSVSQCPPHWHRWGDKCYLVPNEEPLTRSEGMEQCQKEGGHLLSIATQEENDFVSNLLSSIGGTSEGFHTSGIKIDIHREKYWLWQDSNIPMARELSFTKWWKGWSSDIPDKSGLFFTKDLESNRCIYLSDSFSVNGESKEVNSAEYFYWKLGRCDAKKKIICEREPLKIGCVAGRGESYNGTANTTESGSGCLPWTKFRSHFGRFPRTDLLRENYCSNPDGDDLPWCYVSSDKTEFCDIPRCPYQEVMKMETSQCSPGTHPCRTGECIHLEWVCDGQRDCPQGDDEENCPDYSDIFLKHSGTYFNGTQIEKWLFSPKLTCASRCIQAKNFLCHSFNYEESTSTCILCQSSAGLSGGLTKDPRWEYHERLDLVPDCSDSFVCSDYKCLSEDKICDGRKDCADGGDEADCIDIRTFGVRIVNGTGPHEGRVEVMVSGEWGQVCDDMWDIEDGNVVCRQLGYTRGAKNTHTNSRFGDGQGFFLMDDLNCLGEESSLSFCNFGGWNKSDCQKNEAASVTCYQDSDICEASQWQCLNGRCIDFHYYCDQIDDCGDSSDEDPEICMSPVSIRLNFDSPLGKSTGSKSDPASRTEGRVEVRYKGLWGTICDDDVSLEEGHVLCRMMGWNGATYVFKNNSFGPGTGPIWLDGLQCLGNENSINSCYHDQWGSSNCDHTEDLGIRCTDAITRNENEQNPSPNSSIDLRQNTSNGIFPIKCGIRFFDEEPKELLASPRIVDGYIPQRGAQPWMAGLRRRTALGSIHECGAFILTDELLLTAAHCLWKYSISEYLIRTGDYNNEEMDRFEDEWLVDNILIHPFFDKEVLFNNDIGIIKIKNKQGKGIKFNERVQPICLAAQTFSYPTGLNCTVAGWGTMSSTAGYSRILQSTLLPIISDSVCRKDHVYGPTRISSGMFCAGYMEGGVDTCQGDSGGPLVCFVDGRFTAVGITSWGHGCARANKPGVYTRLTEYLEWIYDATEAIRGI